MIEYKFQEENSINIKIYYYCNFIYNISTTLLFIGYLIRDLNFEGLIYVFILSVIIIICLILIYPQQKDNNSFLLHFSKDYNVYNELRLLLKVLERGK